MSNGFIPSFNLKGFTMQYLNLRTASWVAGLASLFLGACVTSNDSGNADPAYANYKVDAQVAGQSLAQNYSQGQNWNTTFTAPSNMPTFGEVSTKVGALTKQAALAKRADINIDSAGKLKANLDDTARGFATIYTESNLLLVDIQDTAIVKWDAEAKDQIKDNEHIVSWKRVSRSLGGLHVETSLFTDGDGDGIINALPSKNSKVRITFTKADPGVTEKTVMLVGAGPNASFDDDSDNTILEATWTKTENGKITGQAAFLDADGDGVVVDNSKDCLVEARYSDLNPKNRPLVKQVDFDAKIKVLAHKAGNEPKSFSYAETMIGGRVNEITMRNRAGGSEIVKNDTMTVRLETKVEDGNDTLQHAVIEFVMNPGNDLTSDTDDVCYAIHINQDKKLGFERHAEFNFVPDAPIPHGQDPKAGSFDGSMTYANGKTASLSGKFSPMGFTAKFIGPDGGSSQVTLTKNGDVTGTP